MIAIREPLNKLFIKPSKETNSTYFHARAEEVKFRYAYKELEGLDKFIREIYYENRSLQTRLRVPELIQPKRMFVYFAVLYLKLTQARIAKYLNLERSTLSYHLYRFQEELGVYEDVYNMAKDVDNYLYSRYLEMPE